MTREEINKFLANTKVYVNGKSKEIQEKLFSLGYKWYTGDIEVHSTEDPFLFIYGNMKFSRSNDMVYFSRRENREISAEEILSLELTEPNYRPFKTQEECWQEMLKHQPFGWLKPKKNRNAALIGNVYMGTEVWIVFATNEKDVFSTSYIFNKFTFADGSPFGIKKE